MVNIKTNLKRFRSIRGRLIIYFVMLVCIISVVTGVMQYNISSEELLENTRDEVSKLASAAALLIDGDKHEELNTTQDELSGTYIELKSTMQIFKRRQE